MPIPQFIDRVQVTSTTTGTGTYTLGSAVTGFQDFTAVGNGNVCFYCAVDVDGSGHPLGGWEVGKGTFTLSGTTLARTTILASSNSNAAVSWSAGTRRVSLTFPAHEAGHQGPTQMLGGLHMMTDDPALAGFALDAGTVFTLYDSFAQTSATNNLNYIDWEPGYDDGQVGRTVNVNKDFTGFYHYPFVQTNSSGTHSTFVNVVFDEGQVTDNGATISDCVNVRIGNPPGGGALGTSTNFSLDVLGVANFQATVSFGGDIFANGYLDMGEDASPGTPSDSRARVYAQSAGGGKTKLMVAFPTGSPVQLAVEP